MVQSGRLGGASAGHRPPEGRIWWLRGGPPSPSPPLPTPLRLPPAHSGGGVHAPNSPVTFRGVHQTTIPCMHASRRCSEGGSKLGMRRQRCVRKLGQKCRLAARPRVPPGWVPPHGRPPEAHETPSVVRPHAAPKVFTPLLRRLHHAGAPAWAARLVHGAPSGASTPPRPPSIRYSASAPLRASLLACFCPLRPSVPPLPVLHPPALRWVVIPPPPLPHHPLCSLPSCRSAAPSPPSTRT